MRIKSPLNVMTLPTMRAFSMFGRFARCGETRSTERRPRWMINAGATPDGLFQQRSDVLPRH